MPEILYALRGMVRYLNIFLFINAVKQRGVRLFFNLRWWFTC